MTAFRLLGLVLTFVAVIAGTHAQEQRTRTGAARDAQTGEPIYVERHMETVRDGRVIRDQVIYLDPQGREFARKEVDFRRRPHVPEFRLLDARNGHLEALRMIDDDLVEVEYRERSGFPLETARVPVPEEGLADAGFDRFIEDNWEQLLAGESFVRQFLVPSRQAFMSFRIRRAPPRDDGGAVGFLLELDSAFLRLLVPSILAVYDDQSRRLVHYEGLSNLRDAGGDNHQVRIRFDYPSQVVRRSE